MVIKNSFNEKSDVIRAGSYTILFSEKYIPKMTTEMVNKNIIIEFLNREMEVCMTCDVFHEFVLGLEMAILIVTNINAYFNDKILKSYVVQVLRDSTVLFKKYGMDLVIVGMTHAWILIENMKGTVLAYENCNG